MNRQRPTLEARGLMPRPALERAPAIVQEAQARAEEKIRAQRTAAERTAAARHAAESAGQADAEALATAAREGKPPPGPTEPALREGLKAAEGASRIVSNDAREAIEALHREIIEQQRELVDGQLPVAMAAAARVAELFQQLDEAFDELDAEAIVLAQFQLADEYRNTVRGRRWVRIGKLDFRRRRLMPWGSRGALADLRAQLAEYEPSGETFREFTAREERKAEESAARRIGRHEMVGGGVFVGSENG